MTDGVLVGNCDTLESLLLDLLHSEDPTYVFGFGGTLAAGSGLVKTATVLSLHLGSFLPLTSTEYSFPLYFWISHSSERY